MSVGRAVPTSLSAAPRTLCSRHPLTCQWRLYFGNSLPWLKLGNLHLPLVTNAQPPTAPCLEFDERTFSRNAKT